MSGAATTFRVANQSMPGNGPRALPVFPDFSTLASQTIDLTNVQSRGFISDIQSVWIDNDADSELTMTIQASRQVIRMPERSQGWVPVIVPNPPVFDLVASVGASVQITFFNVPMPYGVYTTTQGGGGAIYSAEIVSHSTVTDTSSAEILAANANRKYMMIAAPVTNDLWVNMVGGVAAIGGTDCIRIPAGTAYETGAFCPTTQIRAICAVGALELTVYEG